MKEITADPPAATVPGDAGPPPARRDLIFAIVSIGLFMIPVGQTIVATALTAIQRTSLFTPAANRSQNTKPPHIPTSRPS